MRTVTRCENYLEASICNQRYWNFRAEIQDTDSGTGDQQAATFQRPGKRTKKTKTKKIDLMRRFSCRFAVGGAEAGGPLHRRGLYRGHEPVGGCRTVRLVLHFGRRHQGGGHSRQRSHVSSRSVYDFTSQRDNFSNHNNT